MQKDKPSTPISWQYIYAPRVLKQVLIALFAQVVMMSCFNWFFTGSFALSSLFKVAQLNWEVVVGAVLVLAAMPKIFAEINQIFKSDQLVKLYGGAGLLFATTAFLTNLPQLYFYSLLFVALATTCFLHARSGNSDGQDASCWQSMLLMSLFGGRTVWPFAIISNITALSAQALTEDKTVVVTNELSKRAEEGSKSLSPVN